MSSLKYRVDNIPELRSWVNQTICDQNQLERDVFRMTERALVRAGEPCGIYFCLHGPRSVKFIAIWDSQSNSVLFYGSNGERQRKLQLAGPVEMAIPQAA